MNSPAPFSLSGHTALITGGARVVLAGRREEELTAGVAEIGELASAQVLDVTHLASLPEIAGQLGYTHGPISIHVNAVAPGWIDTEMPRKAFTGDPARRKKILARAPLGRLGEPSDIGWTIAWLCSPATRFVTSSIISVDGGASIGF